MAIVMVEHTNQNIQRKYPFSDAATLRSKSGYNLPCGFITDLALYPINVSGKPYVSSIDLAKGIIVFSADNDFAYAKYDSTGGACDIMMLYALNAKVGTIVVDPSVLTAPDVLLEFDYNDTELSPSACVIFQQTGVTGFVLPDGTVVTGDVKIIGEDGVWVNTFYDDESLIEPDAPVLRIDAVGVAPKSMQDCDPNLPPPVRRIIVSTAAGCPIGVSSGGSTVLYLNIRGTSLTDLCASGKAIYRDYVDDIPEPPEDSPEYTAIEEIFDIAAARNNAFIIAAPNTTGYVNPISIQTMDTPAVPAPGITRTPVASITDVENSMLDALSANHVAGGILFKLHGFGTRRKGGD